MASRRGDKRLVASHGNVTSVGLCLALVTALFVAGCGGSASPASTSVGQDTGSAAQAAADAGGPGSTKGSTAEGSEAPGSAVRAGGSAEREAGSARDGSGKKGPRIAQPKGAPEHPITAKQRGEATIADMTLQSPAVGSPAGEVGALPTRYTCNGDGSWPQLLWTGVPKGTAELVVYAMSSQPVEGKLFVDWAVAGIDPSSPGIEAGELPKGAIVGTNSFGKRGYSICPVKGSEVYIFAVYALPTSLSLAAGFDGRETRKRILDTSGNVGLLATSYGS